MGLPGVRTFVDGAGPLVPNQVIAFPDLRVRSYGVGMIDVPLFEDGDGPNRVFITLEIDDPGRTFKSDNVPLYTYFLDPISGTEKVANGIALLNFPTKKSWSMVNGMSMGFLYGLVLPGAVRFQVVNFLANDPGVAVPGTMKAYFYRSDQA